MRAKRGAAAALAGAKAPAARKEDEEEKRAEEEAAATLEDSEETDRDDTGEEDGEESASDEAEEAEEDGAAAPESSDGESEGAAERRAGAKTRRAGKAAAPAAATAAAAAPRKAGAGAGPQKRKGGAAGQAASQPLSEGNLTWGAKKAKKSRLVWTPELHTRFVDAVNHLGIENSVPKIIVQLMNVEGLSRQNVASHLQKYRIYLKKNGGAPPEDMPLDASQSFQKVLPVCLTDRHQIGPAPAMMVDAEERFVPMYQKPMGAPPPPPAAFAMPPHAQDALGAAPGHAGLPMQVPMHVPMMPYHPMAPGYQYHPHHMALYQPFAPPYQYHPQYAMATAQHPGAAAAPAAPAAPSPVRPPPAAPAGEEAEEAEPVGGRLA